MKARTLPLMTALQMGQWRRLAAQSPQTTRWPHGMKTMDTSLSMHTLQVLSSCSCRSSSSGLASFTAGEKIHKRIVSVQCVLTRQSRATVYPPVILSFPGESFTCFTDWPLSLAGVWARPSPALELRLMSGSEKNINKT